jgi:hypothetical protein
MEPKQNWPLVSLYRETPRQANAPCGNSVSHTLENGMKKETNNIEAQNNRRKHWENKKQHAPSDQDRTPDAEISCDHSPMPNARAQTPPPEPDAGCNEDAQISWRGQN